MDIDSVYRLYFRDVFLFLQGLTHNETLAEELTQETFFKALDGLKDYDDRQDVRAWLFTVARRMSNAWVAAQAVAGARNARMVPPAAEDFTARVVEVDAANQHLSAALAAMLRLGEEDREVLELCGLFGFTPAQASITLGVPAGTVRARLHRARQRLSEAIDGEVAA